MFRYSRLINFLRERAQVEQLVRYITEEPPEDADNKRTFKFPFVACEIFTCEIDVILKTLVEEEELMQMLFSFLEPNRPHSASLAGYFSKSFQPKAVMNSELSFFKIITSCEKMGLPPGACSQMQHLLDHGLKLRDVYNNLWAMEVEIDGDSLYFNKDWPQFYKDNCLEPNDALVFLHHHHNLFDFKLIGRDGCEKKGVGGPRVSVKEEYEEEEAEEEEEENDEEYIDEDDEDYVDEEGESEEEEQSLQLKRVCCGCGNDMTPIPASPIRRVKEEEESQDYDGIEKEAEETRKAEFRPTKKTYTKKSYYGADIFKLGLASRPKNPYFVSRSRQARGHHLCIPKEVIVEYKLSIGDRVKLVDGSGREWDADVSKWKDGRVWCNKGWRSLCEMNNIGVEDTCICEFVQHQQQPLHILVQPLSLSLSKK